MGYFSRPGRAIVKNYHSYIPSNKTLQNIGLGSYTRNTLLKFGISVDDDGTETDSPEISEYFGGKIPRDKLLGDHSSTKLSLMPFDLENKLYTTEIDEEIWNTPSGTSAGSLQEFQKSFDDFQKGFITDDAEKWKINYTWEKIKNSYSGCITFNVDYTVLTAQDSGIVKLYFEAAGKSSSDRGIAYQSNLVIAGPPARATGAEYSQAGFQNTGPGVYPPKSEGGHKNPDNTVAGQLRLHYDQSTGKWESGTMQSLFRLLSDIDGVSLKELPKNPDTVDIESFYSGPLSSEFTLGSGMALSVENGNPYMFGPNSAGCGPSKKERVILVNRTPRSYSRGEIVIASLINGEWIPMGFGPAKIVPKKLEIEWSKIQKYIVDAKSFFRNQNDTETITPEKYEQHVRYNFYSSLRNSTNKGYLQSSGNDLDKLAIVNILQQDPSEYRIDDGGKIILPRTTVESIANFTPIVNMVPSTGYLEFFDADVMKTKLGGNNDDSRFVKGNIKQTPVDYPDTNDVYATTVQGSWGMYFPDGYSSANVSRLVNGPTSVKSAFSEVPGGKDVENYIIYNKNSTLNFSTATDTIDIDLSDANFYHLPAQFGLNSSGNQSIFNMLWWATPGLGTNFFDQTLKYIANPLKGDYIKYTGSNKTVYGLSPINPGLVQFTPLSLELALCSTEIPDDHSISAENGGYSDLKQNLNYTEGKITPWNKKAFGKAWNRLAGQETKDPAIFDMTNKIRGYVGIGNYLRSPNGFTSPNRNDLKPDGGPGILPQINGNEISNVVGVIGAMATIGLSAGGSLKLTTNNKIGLNTYKVARGGGGQIDVTIIGGMTWASDSRGAELKPEGTPQWGASTTDDIKAFGTTSLWCRATDHSDNVIYDTRYFAPLHFHGNSKDLDGKSINIDTPAIKSDNGSVSLLNPGTIINSSDNIVMLKNPIRANMLLTGGGFYYIERSVAADPDGIEILSSRDPEKPPGGFEEGEIFTFGGADGLTATFVVAAVDQDKKITKMAIGTDVIGEDGKPLGLKAYGKYKSNTLKNRDGYIEGASNTVNGVNQRVILKKLKVIERVVHDEFNTYGNISMLTPKDNNGGGDTGNGYITSSKTTSFELPPNPNGKYDFFFFFVNDIMNYPENSAGATYIDFYPFAQYVNLEITAT